MSPNLVMEYRNTSQSLSKMMHQPRYTNVTVFLLVLSLIGQLIGFVTPTWTHIKKLDVTIDFGLWYKVTCRYGVCETNFINQDFGLKSVMIEYQIETSIAIICCISAIIGLLIHTRYLKVVRNSAEYTLIIIATLGSGVLCLVAASKFRCQKLTFMKEECEKALFPISLMFTGIGGVFSTIALMVFVCTLYKESNQYNFLYRQPPENPHLIVPMCSPATPALTVSQDYRQYSSQQNVPCHLAQFQQLPRYINEDENDVLLPPRYCDLFGNNA